MTWLAEPAFGAVLANHLWQSTLCVAGAAILVRLLKHQAARWRYRVWLAASLKFFVPFALLSALGANVPVTVFSSAPSSNISTAIEFLGQPFGGNADIGPAVADDALPATDAPLLGADPPAAAPAALPVAPVVLFSLWMGGCLALLAGKAIRRRRLHVLLRTARSLTRGREADALERAKARVVSGTTIEVCVFPSLVEPGVVGIAKPIILWPMALSARLNDPELDAIFAHELEHVHRRDNLTAALHGVLKIALWFHPLIWWLKSRLIAERERACDEAVLRFGSEPHAYARGILKVCKFCLQSPAVTAAAVTGADLTRRMEDIMSARKASSLTLAQRLLLGLTALGIVAGPVVAGSLQATPFSTPLTRQPGTWHAAVVSAAAPFDVAVEPQAPPTRVTGTVTDVRGAAIADATVAAAPEGGGTGFKTQTDASGRYSMDLPPAQYELTVTKPGFSIAKSTVFVARGISLQRDVRLNMGAVSETINVKDLPTPAPSLEATAEILDRVKTLIQQGSLAEAERELSRATLGVRAARSTATAASRPPLTGSGGGPIVRVGGDVREPRKLQHKDPLYPAEARAAKVSGIVILDALIGTDGTVKDLKIVRGQALLNQAALDAVQQWVFTPTMLNGAPVEVMMTVTVNFQLQ